MNDSTIRNWFNGPALLTWSRGQNEYGGDIAGPLPRSWMKAQWSLQKQILNRTRALGMVGQLPAFQAAVPSAMIELLSDSNMTDNGQGTAWLDSLDPHFLTIASDWMETMIADFGTDHWYQLDGYFNGGTAPWMSDDDTDAHWQKQQLGGAAPPPPAPPDPNWPKRGAKAWASLANTDPKAVWSFQGWAINNADKARDMMHGFIQAVPPGQFSIIDMASDGRGEWHAWLTNPDGSPDPVFSSANFIWTSLHDFGGSDSLRGNITQVNEIPFAALAPEQNTSVWGTGFTPEGIDQNPAFYEFLIEQNWRTARVPNITQHLIERAHRRYGLTETNAEVSIAWALLTESAYQLDLWGMDSGGTTHIPGTNYNNFAWENVGATPCTSQHCPADYTKPIQPTANMCKIYRGWEALIAAGPQMDAKLEPWNYDLVNTGREVLNQLMLPASQVFNMSLNDTEALSATTASYVDLLLDLDELVATDTAFSVGGWIEQAKKLAKEQGGDDCLAKDFTKQIKNCDHFYEWNARVQITTWDPTPLGAAKPGKETVDYASKHWSGLIRDYYVNRVKITAQQAKLDNKGGVPLDPGALNKQLAQVAFEWTVAQSPYPTDGVGDALAVSKKMQAKYKGRFASC